MGLSMWWVTTTPQGTPQGSLNLILQVGELSQQTITKKFLVRQTYLGVVFTPPKRHPHINYLCHFFTPSDESTWRNWQANRWTVRCDGNVDLFPDPFQLVQMARQDLPRHHQENNCAEIASRSIHFDASASGNFLHRNVVDGDESKAAWRVSEEISSDLRTLLPVLDSGSDDKLPFNSTAFADRLHGMRLVLLGQHPLLH